MSRTPWDNIPPEVWEEASRLVHQKRECVGRDCHKPLLDNHNYEANGNFCVKCCAKAIGNMKDRVGENRPVRRFQA